MYTVSHTAADCNVRGFIHRVYCIYTVVVYLHVFFTLPENLSCGCISQIHPIPANNKRCVKTASHQAIYSLPNPLYDRNGCRGAMLSLVCRMSYVFYRRTPISWKCTVARDSYTHPQKKFGANFPPLSSVTHGQTHTLNPRIILAFESSAPAAMLAIPLSLPCLLRSTVQTDNHPLLLPRGGRGSSGHGCYALAQ